MLTGVFYVPAYQLSQFREIAASALDLKDLDVAHQIAIAAAVYLEVRGEAAEDRFNFDVEVCNVALEVDVVATGWWCDDSVCLRGVWEWSQHVMIVSQSLGTAFVIDTPVPSLVLQFLC